MTAEPQAGDAVPDSRVLIVDDCAESARDLAALVAGFGWSARTAGSLAEAEAALEDEPFGVVLADLHLGDGEGTQLLKHRERLPALEVIVVTGHATVDTAVEAMRSGAHDYMTKPVDPARLDALFAGLRRTQSLKRKIGRLRGELRQLGRFGRMVGSSPAMQELYSLIDRVAPTDAGVLIVGESGTGKELVAATIHDESERWNGPFVPINCGAVARTLIESELFGHERGAFTGAEKSHAGCFERAEGGTLFLDEITEMSADLQVKLLRVLEERRVRRVGASEERDIDVRIVAATNREPTEAMEDGRLREDLYYRLNVFPIRLPALRERRDDIELLAEHLLDRLNERAGMRKFLAPDAIEALKKHDWPGNVRELSNVIQQAHILADEVIDVKALPRGFASRSAREGVILRVQVGSQIAAVEKRLLLATLRHFAGDKKTTAERLGISLKTLYNRLNEYSEDAAEAQG